MFLTPDNEKVNFHILIGDNRSGLEYDSRFDVDFIWNLEWIIFPFPTGFHQNQHSASPAQPEGPKDIMVLHPDNRKPRDIYLDNIRLE